MFLVFFQNQLLPSFNLNLSLYFRISDTIGLFIKLLKLLRVCSQHPLYPSISNLKKPLLGLGFTHHIRSNR